MAKITKATFKSMLRKNEGNLYIKQSSKFDGMFDCVMPTGDGTYSPLQKASSVHENNLGYQGIWLVGGSGNLFHSVEENGFKGIRVYNCCGEFTVAVK